MKPTLIRWALRKLWMTSPTRHQAVKSARISRGLYVCRECTRAFKISEVQVDHIVPVGKTPGVRGAGDVTWDEFMRRLFCPVEGLQVLCHGCHQAKTSAG